MSINNALAGVAVKDLKTGIAWYEKLLGRPADSRPMPEVAEWKFPNGGWMQVFQDSNRAGSSSVTLAVSGIESHLSELSGKGIAIGRKTQSGKVSTAIVNDPDGNQVVLGEALAADMAR